MCSSDLDEDGDGMDDDGDDNVVDATFTETPLPIEHQPLQEEIDAAQAAGHQAASEGKPESDCPKIAGPLCIAWIKGWKAWHDEQTGDDPLYADVVAHVVEQQRVTISMVQRHFRIGYNRAARLIEKMEAEGIVSAMDANGNREVHHGLKNTEEQE